LYKAEDLDIVKTDDAWWRWQVFLERK
jgi:hypothetical protein